MTQSFFYITNHRGDTVALVNEAGDVVGTYAYDAWGNPISSIQHPGSPAPYFTFSSKHYDENACLYYYGFRWYDPAAKRWTQPDPEGLSEGLDLYQFCGNDPVNGVDEYGSRRAVIVVGDLNNILDIAVLNKWLLESRAAEEANKFRKAGWDVHFFNAANRDQNGECTMSSWRDDIIDAIDKPDTEVLIIYAHGQNPILDSILCSLYSLATFDPSLIPSFWPPQASTGVKLFKREWLNYGDLPLRKFSLLAVNSCFSAGMSKFCKANLTLLPHVKDGGVLVGYKGRWLPQIPWYHKTGQAVDELLRHSR